MAVGDTAESVSRRRLDPLPNVRAWVVLRESFGRDWWEEEGGWEGWVRIGGVTMRDVVILLGGRS